MKRIVLFLSVLIAFSACDKIDSDNFIDGEIIVQPEDIDRKILIEDFTGHKCQNCPEQQRKFTIFKTHFQIK